VSYIYVHLISKMTCFDVSTLEPPRSTQPGHPFLGRHNRVPAKVRWRFAAGE